MSTTTSRVPAKKKPAVRKTAATKPTARMTRAAAATSASQAIDQRIAELNDWRGELLARGRALIRQVAPEIVETWKWRGVPVWERDGIVCTGETYKAVVKFTFAKGARLPDPKRLFNSSLDGNTRRAIDLHEGDTLNAAAFKALVRAAIDANAAARRGKR